MDHCFSGEVLQYRKVSQDCEAVMWHSAEDNFSPWANTVKCRGDARYDLSAQ